jgi:putative transposase
VLGIYGRATANTAKQYLDELIERTPFAIRAIQVDGGSEYKAAFEVACRERGIALFVLPPSSPKLNGCVERGNRTHREEF